MVAESPSIHYDDQSASLNSPPQQQQTIGEDNLLQATNQQQQTFGDNSSQPKAVDIHAYAPPWSSLTDYATNSQTTFQQQSVTISNSAPDSSSFASVGHALHSPPASPRFEQIISQVSFKSSYLSSYIDMMISYNYLSMECFKKMKL